MAVSEAQGTGAGVLEATKRGEGPLCRGAAGGFARDGPRKNSGSAGRTRTCDQVVNSHPLYRLSYRGTDALGM